MIPDDQEEASGAPRVGDGWDSPRDILDGLPDDDLADRYGLEEQEVVDRIEDLVTGEKDARRQLELGQRLSEYIDEHYSNTRRFESEPEYRQDADVREDRVTDLAELEGDSWMRYIESNFR